MKNKFFKVILLLICFEKPCYSQQTKLDSLSNLYIITIDKSGSMLWNNQHRYVLQNRDSIAEKIVKRLNENPVFDSVNYNKDKFVFFNSGILNTNNLVF